MKESSCKDAKHRSKMPYIQYSAKQVKMILQEEQTSKMPIISVPSRDSDDENAETVEELITIDALVKAPKCPWNPPCDVAFGSKSFRFPQASKKLAVS